MVGATAGLIGCPVGAVLGAAIWEGMAIYRGVG